MERLVALMCWLFDGEQHQVVEVEVTFEKKTARYKRYL
jgi:hypothetical protein